MVTSEEARAVAIVNAALVLLADHELATSTMAARIAASARSDVFSVVLTGMGPLAGPLHGSASGLVHQTLADAASRGARAAVATAVERHGSVPGFGHPLYPDGDPRAALLLAQLAEGFADAPEIDAANAVMGAVDLRSRAKPNIDFALLPFDLTVDDLDEHADRLVESIAGAVADADVPHVVLLSSGGADLVEGTGPITGLHLMEAALKSTGTVLSALRSGHFQEKLADVLDTARESGIYPVFAGSADVPIPMVATADLGAVAASILQSPPSRSEAIDVLGPAYSERAVAAVLGRALGRELTIELIPEEAWADVLTEAGFRSHIAASLAELYRADQQGLLAPRGDRRVSGHASIEVTIDRLLRAN